MNDIIFPEPPGLDKFDHSQIQDVYPADDPRAHNVPPNPTPCWCKPHNKGKMRIHRYSDKREYQQLADIIFKKWLLQ